MKNGKAILGEMRGRLRGTFVHRIYALVKYDLYILLVFKIYWNIRRKNYSKIRHFLKRGFAVPFRELPRSVAIDVVSCCNLRCPLCSVPPFITKKAGNFMPFEDFKRVVDALNITTDLSLVYAGEPLLHPDFFKMVQYCNRSFYTTTITNGTLLTEKNVDKILESGLDFLQISFDGFRKESYEKYRIGADFESVKDNIVKFLKRRRHAKEGLPHTTMTYLINAYNEEEVDDCERFFRRAGAERFFAKAINLNVHRRTDGKWEEDLRHWLPKKSRTSLYDQQDDGLTFKAKKEACTICLTPIVKCDGEVLLCCHDIFNRVKIGNVFEKDFAALWFSPEYRKTRNLAKDRKLPVCQKCGK